jgi:hypothetical protein
MTSTDHLPLLDLFGDRDPATITNLREALLRYGAFRLWAPNLKEAYSLELRRNVGTFGSLLLYVLITRTIQVLEFFQLPLDAKKKTKGYSGFDSELIRGDTPIPKESIYFFRKEDSQGDPPPSALHDSVVALHDVRSMSFPPRNMTISNIQAEEMETVERHHILNFI